MKKLIFAGLLTAVLTAFCWASAWWVEEICESTAARLQTAETCLTLGDYAGAQAEIQAAQSDWQRREGFLGMALRHTESDDVEILFPILLEACRQKDENEALLRIRELTATLKQLGRMEQAYSFNIL